MKSTLKVHNPRVVILLICINDVQGVFKCVIYEGYSQQPSLLAVQNHSDSLMVALKVSN